MGRGRVGGRGPGTRRYRKAETTTRVLRAERVAERLVGGNAAVKLVVTGLKSGKEVGEEELKALPGF
jgi:hypothetical protein